MIAYFLGHLLSALWNALKMFFVPCTSNVFSNHSDCDSASQPSEPPVLDSRPFSPQPIAPVGCLFRRLLTLRPTPSPAFVDDLEAQMSSEESSLQFTHIDSLTSLDYQDSVSGLDPEALNGLDVDSSQQQLSGRINVSPAPSDSGVILSDESDPMVRPCHCNVYVASDLLFLTQPSASSEGSETHYYDFSDEHRESDISTPNSNNSDVGDDVSCPGPGELMTAPVPVSVSIHLSL